MKVYVCFFAYGFNCSKPQEVYTTQEEAQIWCEKEYTEDSGLETQYKEFDIG